MTERALLIRLGALGDTLHASSAASLLKKQDPNMEVDFLSADGLGDLFRMIPSVTEAFCLPYRRIPLRFHPRWQALLGRLNHRAYSLAYLMETDPRFLPILEAIEADRKVTLTESANGDTPGAGLPNPVRYQSALRDAGLATGDTCHPELFVSEEGERRATELLDALGLDLDAPVIGLHPGNSYQGRKIWRKKLRRTDLRCWPEVRWVELVREMNGENPRLQFVLFGGPRDRKTNERVSAQLRVLDSGLKLADAAGKTDLILAAALLRRFALFVSTDTGPLHMAAALRVPFVGLYGPTRFEETQPFPPEPVGAVLRQELDCQPCYGTPIQRRCRDNICMERIESVDVVEKARELNPVLFQG